MIELELTTEELSDRGKLKLSSDKNILRGVDTILSQFRLLSIKTINLVKAFKKSFPAG